MNSVAGRQRGAASGMRGTFLNAGSSLSIGVFFSLMVAGLAAALPTTLTDGLHRAGRDRPTAAQIGDLPPVGSLFAAFLGFNPVETLLGPTGAWTRCRRPTSRPLTGPEFFPHLISAAVPQRTGHRVRRGRVDDAGGGGCVYVRRRQARDALDGGRGRAAGRGGSRAHGCDHRWGRQ